MTQKTVEERIVAIEKQHAKAKAWFAGIMAVWSVIAFGAGWFAYLEIWKPVDVVKGEIKSVNASVASVKAENERIRQEIEERKKELRDLTGRAAEAKTLADQAMLKAGTLEVAVDEAKRAARASQDASEEAKATNQESLEMIQKVKEIAEGARTASEASSKASQGASTAAQEASRSLAEVKRLAEYAKALTNDIDRTMKGYDRKIAVLSTTFEKIRSMLSRSPQPQPGAGVPRQPTRPKPRPQPRKITIDVTGTGATIYLNPGPSLLDAYRASATGYEGEFLIPESATVTLNIPATGVMIYAHRSLRGRIIENRTGTGGQIVYR